MHVKTFGAWCLLQENQYMVYTTRAGTLMEIIIKVLNCTQKTASFF